MANSIFVSLKAWLPALILDCSCFHLLAVKHASGFKTMNVEEVRAVLADEVFEGVSTLVISLLSNSNTIALCKQRDLYNFATLTYIAFTWDLNSSFTSFIRVANCSIATLKSFWLMWILDSIFFNTNSYSQSDTQRKTVFLGF